MTFNAKRRMTRKPRRPTPLEITTELITIDSMNPPGGDDVAVAYLSQPLSEADYKLETYEFAPVRSGLMVEAVLIGWTGWRHK